MRYKPSGIFIKAQLSSALSSMADFTTTYALTSIFGFWYVFTSIIGTITGGIVNFLVNKNWVFRPNSFGKKMQFLKFATIWGLSLFLNTNGVILLTEVFKIHYLISKAFVSIVIGVFFNYYFQYNFVFANNEKRL